jgi:hypothetical protein
MLFDYNIIDRQVIERPILRYYSRESHATFFQLLVLVWSYLGWPKARFTLSARKIGEIGTKTAFFT